MPHENSSEELPKFHRFIDEVGDTTFYGGRRRLILGQEGVSNTFGIGLLKLNEPIAEVRKQIRLVIDLYDSEKYEASRNYYGRNKPLTAANKIGPPST